MPAGGALVTVKPDPRGGGSSPERNMSQLADHVVTDLAVAAATVPPSRPGRPGGTPKWPDRTRHVDQ